MSIPLGASGSDEDSDSDYGEEDEYDEDSADVSGEVGN